MSLPGNPEKLLAPIMTPTKAIILAAGKGTRMKSDLPKVLFPALGRPMVEFVLDAVEAAGVSEKLVVVGYRSDLVRQALSHRRGITFVEQHQQLGTGHAVQQCVEHLVGFDGAVLVLTGDSPLTQSRSLMALMADYERDRPACVLGTLVKDDPRGLGRILRDPAGHFLGIIEEKDANDAQKAIREVNMSTYVFDAPRLIPALARLTSNNRQGEFYITDCPAILRESGYEVRAIPVLDPREALSVNSVEELRAVEEEMQRS